MNPTPSPTDPRLEALARIFSEEFLADNLTVMPSHRLRKDFGIDSIDYLDLVIKIEGEYNISIPKDSLDYANILTVGDILSELNELLGPALPTDNYLELTEDQFITRYNPEKDEDGDIYVQREWDAKSTPTIRKAIEEKRCWTMVETDGQLFIVWGNATVNRLYNIITENPIEDETWHVVAQDLDESPMVMCVVAWDFGEDDDPGDIPTEIELRLQDVDRSFETFIGDTEQVDSILDYLSDSYGWTITTMTCRELKKENNNE